MKLNLWFHNERFATVMVKTNEHYVSDLKMLIEKAAGIPAKTQTLTCSAITLEDDKLVKDYGLKPSSVIVLSLPIGFQPDISITVKTPEGDILRVKCRHNCTVGAMKKLLRKSTKIPVAQQALTHKIWLLDDDAMMLTDYAIRDNSFIRMMYAGSTKFPRVK